jgi:methyltransferase (TIGR00027 family)
MRTDEPSRTARGVAAARSTLPRLPWGPGDPEADERLTASLLETRPITPPVRSGRTRGGFAGYIEARTAFFDTAVVGALERDVRQIVILGAGYDGRALRYRTPGVQFFEVDHPATQADKRRHLERINVSVEDIAFVAADLTEPGLATALADAGFDIAQPSQFLCEGLLRYLPERWFRELFVVTAECAAPTSELAASISTRNGDVSDDERAREDALALAGEAVLTVPRAEVALEWLAAAGWTPVTVEDSARRETDSRRGRLLVRARRTEPWS